ncbi:Non-histone chromosomal protein 6 [Allomyces javanicus]|nr:Non-histone chromosomal protein 6 [Allomyces javanicus]
MPKTKSETATKRVRKEKAEKKPRAKKDPNKPKRPMTAFFIFSGEFRDQVKAQNPGATVGTVAKILGERWRNMGEAEKAPYAIKVEQDKKRYETELAIYEANKSADAAAAEEAEEEDE